MVRAAEAEGATVLVIGGSQPHRHDLRKPGIGQLASDRCRLGDFGPRHRLPELPPVRALVATLLRLPLQSHAGLASGKGCYLAATCLLRSFAVILQIATAVIVLLIIDYGSTAAQDLQRRILIVFGIWRVSNYFFAALLGSEAPSHRMLRFSDEDAVALRRHLALTMLVGFALVHLVAFLAGVGIGADLSGLSFVFSSFVVAFLLTLVCFRHRVALAEAIVGPAKNNDMDARILARLWPILAGLYFLMA